jgi:GDP-mannose 6-dehydrogenase
LVPEQNALPSAAIEERLMKITVFGMGYVGCVSAACLAEQGHEVTGVDVDDTKVSLVNEGRSPIVEPGLEELIQRGIQSRKLCAVTRASALGDVVMVCVGTPSNENGSLGLDHMLKVIGDIGDLLRSAPKFVVIAIRSTVLPGTVQETIIPRLEQRSGKVCGREFGVCMNPEFMRETTSVKDFADPPFTVIGAQDEFTARQMAEVYGKLSAPVELTTIREAEMVKYACNAFHATKVCFANEIGKVAKQLDVDSHRVMDILCKDTKLNLSPYYLKPGFAFGGSCLPKDLRAILYKARQVDVELPMLSSLLESNRKHVELAFDMVRRTGKMSVGMLGLSFKAGTDDLRESPIVTLAESLIGKGYRLKVYDEEVSLAKIRGANRRYIEQTIPHISSLMTPSLEEVVGTSEVVLVAKKGPQFLDAIRTLPDDRIVIDLVRLFTQSNERPHLYEGLCW